MQPRHHIGNCSSQVKKKPNQNRKTIKLLYMKLILFSKLLTQGIGSLSARPPAGSLPPHPPLPGRGRNYNIRCQTNFPITQAWSRKMLLKPSASSYALPALLLYRILQAKGNSASEPRERRVHRGKKTALFGCLHRRAPAPRSPFSATLGSVTGYGQNR